MERWLNGSAENYIYYYYDESGVCGMCYNGSEYYYRKNIFGDVIEIYNNLGTLQCRYVYDAWGNHKVYNASGSEIGAEVANIGNVNPIRYRGYYWDKEFNLYYLQSRYYDPMLGRFISADNIDYLEPNDVIGLNLYVYCYDNPIMYYDPNGHSLLAIFLILAATTIAGGVIGAKKAADEGKKGWDFAKNIILGAAMGLAVGGAALAITGVAAGAVAGTSYVILGVKASQLFAIGALAFDFTAFFVAPLFGIEMQGIEYETPQSPYQPPTRNPLPPHPYNQRRHGR